MLPPLSQFAASPTCRTCTLILSAELQVARAAEKLISGILCEAVASEDEMNKLVLCDLMHYSSIFREYFNE